MSEQLRLSSSERSVVKECIVWLQTANIWIKEYPTNPEQLQELFNWCSDVHSASSLLSPYTDSEGLREGWKQCLTRELGHRDSELFMADLGEHNGQYTHLTAACEKVGMTIACKPV